MAFVALALVGISIVAGPARAEDGIPSPSLLAAGHGLDVGLLGARYARRIGGGLTSLGAGVGLAGVSPKLTVHAFGLAGWNLNVGAGVLYGAWESVVFSQGSVLGYAVAGIERWPYQAESASLFIRGAAGVAKQFRGTAEGGTLGAAPTVELQAGLSF